MSAHRWGLSAPGTWAALAYDAANMAMKALESVGAERAKIKDWFASRKDGATGFAGVTGVTFFDEHGDCPSKPASVVVVKNGAYEAWKDGKKKATSAYKKEAFGSGRIGIVWSGIGSFISRLEVTGKLDYKTVAADLRKAKQ